MAGESIDLSIQIKDQGATASLRRVKKSVEDLGDSQETVGTKAERAGKTSSQAHEGAAKKSGSAWESALSKIKGGLSGLGGAASTALSKLPAGAEKAGAATGKVLAAAGAAAFAGGIAGMLGASFKKAIDQASDVSLFGARNGLSPEAAQAAGTAAGKVYAQGFGEQLTDVQETAATMQQLLSKGYKGGAGLEELTTYATNLSQVMGTDLTTSVTTVQSMLSSGLAPTAKDAFDIITGAMQNTAGLAREEIPEALNEYAKHFAELGITGQETGTLLVKAGEMGQYGVDKMGDALKELTIRATDGSKATSAALGAVGTTTEEVATAFAKGGPTARAALQKITDGLYAIDDPATQAQTAIALFGTPLEDLGANKVPQFLQALGGGKSGMMDFAGSAQSMADTVNSGPAAQLSAFGRTVEQSFVQIGAALIPVLQPLLTFLTPLAPVLAPIALGIAAVTAAVTLLAAGISIVNVLLAANPVVFVVVGIVAAVAGIVAAIVWAYNTFGWFKAGVDAVVSGVVAAWQNWLWPAIQLVGQGIAALWTGVVVPAAQLLGSIIGGVVNWIVRFFTDLWSIAQVVWRGLVVLWQTYVQPGITVLVSAFQVLSNWWNGTLIPIIQTVSSYFSETLGGAIRGLQGVGDAIARFFQPAVDFFKNTLMPIVDTVKGALGGIGDAVNGAIGAGQDFVSNPLGGMQDWLGIEHKADGGVLGYSGGGTLPGYSPGVDNMLFRTNLASAPSLALSGGESIMVPQFARHLGKSGVAALNRASEGGAQQLRTAMRSGGDTYVTVNVQGDGDPSQIKAAVRAAVREAKAEDDRRSYEWSA